MITIAVSMMAFAMWNLIEVNQDQKGVDKMNKQYDIFADNKMRVIAKMIQNTNSWWSAEDILSCSWWIIKSYVWAAPVCTWTWEAWADWISDVCDNDDYKWSYAWWYMTWVLSSDSKLTDNDDYSRRTSFWYIAPNATDSVFAANDNISDFIDQNPYNTGSVINMSAATWMILSWKFSSIWNLIQTYKLNKASFNSSKKVDIIDSFSWVITDNTWILLDDWNFSSTWTPYSFDFANFDYAVNVTNSSGGMLSYELEWTSSGKQVYIYPIDDSKEEMKAIFPYYEISPWKAYYKWQELFFWQRTLKTLACLLPWWSTIEHSWTISAYSLANPIYPTLCQGETRTCTDGYLDWAYENQACIQWYIYTWNIWSWSSCSTTCWDWTQTRTVTCQRNDWAIVDDSYCWTYPWDTQACNLHQCPCTLTNATYSCDHSSAGYSWNTFQNVNPLIYPLFSVVSDWTAIYSWEILYETAVRNYSWWLKCSDWNIIWDDWVSWYLYICN